MTGCFLITQPEMSEYRLFESVPHTATVRAEELFVLSITVSLCSKLAFMGTKFMLMADTVLLP